MVDNFAAPTAIIYMFSVLFGSIEGQMRHREMIPYKKTGYAPHISCYPPLTYNDLSVRRIGR